MDNIAGMAYQVVDNRSCHSFEIDEVVVSMDDANWDYKSVTTGAVWCLEPDDLVPFNITDTRSNR